MRKLAIVAVLMLIGCYYVCRIYGIYYMDWTMPLTGVIIGWLLIPIMKKYPGAVRGTGMALMGLRLVIFVVAVCLYLYLLILFAETAAYRNSAIIPLAGVAILLTIFLYFLDWDIHMWTTGRQRYRTRLRLWLIFLALFIHITVIFQITDPFGPLKHRGWISNLFLFFPISFLFVMMTILPEYAVQESAQALQKNEKSSV